MTDRELQPGIEPGSVESKTGQLVRRLDTDEDRRFWAAVDAAAREVETWPWWKRGESILDRARPGEE